MQKDDLAYIIREPHSFEDPNNHYSTILRNNLEVGMPGIIQDPIPGQPGGYEVVNFKWFPVGSTVVNEVLTYVPHVILDLVSNKFMPPGSRVKVFRTTHNSHPDDPDGWFFPGMKKNLGESGTVRVSPIASGL